jgi:hypothetical protein
MNNHLQTIPPPKNQNREIAASNILGMICFSIELTKQQRERAEDTYKAITKYLSNQLDGYILALYPQGSMAHHTTVRPYLKDEHDLV